MNRRDGSAWFPRVRVVRATGGPQPVSAARRPASVKAAVRRSTGVFPGPSVQNFATSPRTTRRSGKDAVATPDRAERRGTERGVIPNFCIDGLARSPRRAGARTADPACGFNPPNDQLRIPFPAWQPVGSRSILHSDRRFQNARQPAPTACAGFAATDCAAIRGASGEFEFKAGKAEARGIACVSDFGPPRPENAGCFESRSKVAGFERPRESARTRAICKP
jgi:hypothetical protein